MSTFQTSGPIAAVLELRVGDITVAACDRDDCTVSIRPRSMDRPADVAAAGDVKVDFINGTLTITSVKPWQRVIGPSKGDGALDVEVNLPTGSSLKATTGMGLVHSEGELTDTIARTGIGDIRLDRVGALNAKSGLGDVTVGRVDSEAKVATTSGSLRLGVLAGSATVKNANGAVEIDECRRFTHVRAANGDITIGRALSSMTAVSAAGDIRIDEVSAGSVTARAGAGAIDIGIREGTAAWLELSARYGTVRNDLTSTSGPESSESTVEVRARCAGGDVTVHRAVTRSGRHLQVRQVGGPTAAPPATVTS